MSPTAKFIAPVLLFSFFAGYLTETVTAADLKMTPSPVQAVSPLPVTAPSVALTSVEKKKLPVEFKKALNDEERAADHQEKSQIKELTASQTAALKSWRLQEKRVRRTFFDQHESGPERRQFVHEYLPRKKAFDQAQKDDLASLKRNWKDKHEQLKQYQKEREIKFKAAIEQNQKPDASLWPQAH